MKRTIGVIIFTKIGTKTSLLTGEFEFWNTFKKFNPDTDFVFIAISNFTRKSILNNRHLLNFPVSIIQVNNENELHKLKGLSGVFSYLTRNTFFGGSLDKACVMNYRISSYCTNDLKIPLFIRTPDSEYPYYDYKRMVDVRINSKTPSTPSFILNNQKEIDAIIRNQYIDYDKTYFIANGNSRLYDWVVDVTHNDIPEAMRIVTTDQARKNSIYVSDEFLFNVPIYSKKYEHFDTQVKNNRFLFIGFMQGSVAKNRVKVLNKMFSALSEDLPTDIIGPGAKDLSINRSDVNLINKSVFGDSYFEILNQYLAYIFIGKGNSINKYINKTIWDCYSAKCPIIVYSPCDQNGLIFKNKEFYFETEKELREIYEKLQDPLVRNRWIEDQRVELRYVLDNMMDPMFSFDDYCELKDSDFTKSDIKVSEPLF
jgi:hypothetical protein